MDAGLTQQYAGTYASPHPRVLSPTWPRALTTPAGRRWGRAALLLALAAWLVWVVTVITRDGLLTALAHHYPELLIALAYLCFGHLLDRVPYTQVGTDGLTARTGMVTKRSVPWTDVVAIQPAARFDPHAVALLMDGSRLGLPGLPAAVAVGLAAAVTGSVDSSS